MLTTHAPISGKQKRPFRSKRCPLRTTEPPISVGVHMMLSRWIVLLLLLGVSGCSGLKLQLEVQRGNQTMMTSAQQALGLKDPVK